MKSPGFSGVFFVREEREQTRIGKTFLSAQDTYKGEVIKNVLYLKEKLIFGKVQNVSIRV